MSPPKNKLARARLLANLSLFWTDYVFYKDDIFMRLYLIQDYLFIIKCKSKSIKRFSFRNYNLYHYVCISPLLFFLLEFRSTKLFERAFKYVTHKIVVWLNLKRLKY